MSKLQEYCDSKLQEAREGKDRAIRHLEVVKQAIEKGEPVGPMQYVHSQKDIDRVKKYIEKWDSEIKVWEAEKELLK